MSEKKKSEKAQPAPLSIESARAALSVVELPGEPAVSVDGATLTLTYASDEDYAARTSLDTEAVRELIGIKSASVTALVVTLTT